MTRVVIIACMHLMLLVPSAGALGQVTYSDTVRYLENSGWAQGSPDVLELYHYDLPTTGYVSEIRSDEFHVVSGGSATFGPATTSQTSDLQNDRVYARHSNYASDVMPYGGGRWWGPRSKSFFSTTITITEPSGFLLTGSATMTSYSQYTYFYGDQEVHFAKVGGPVLFSRLLTQGASDPTLISPFMVEGLLTPGQYTLLIRSESFPTYAGASQSPSVDVSAATLDVSLVIPAPTSLAAAVAVAVFTRRGRRSR